MVLLALYADNTYREKRKPYRILLKDDDVGGRGITAVAAAALLFYLDMILFLEL